MFYSKRFSHARQYSTSENIIQLCDVQSIETNPFCIRSIQHPRPNWKPHSRNVKVSNAPTWRADSSDVRNCTGGQWPSITRPTIVSEFEIRNLNFARNACRFTAQIGGLFIAKRLNIAGTRRHCVTVGAVFVFIILLCFSFCLLSDYLIFVYARRWFPGA